MNADFLALVSYWEREKGISKEVLFRAVEEALVAAARKAVGPARDLRCTIDRKTGDIKAFAKLIVVDHVVSRHDHIAFDDAKRISAAIQLGDELEIEVTPSDFGRIASQNARQSFIQQIRKAEKEMIYEEFKDRAGEIISGAVRGFEGSDVRIDLGKHEAVLPNRERVRSEEYQTGDRIRCFVKKVENTAHGPEIVLSRADPQFVVKLFKLEVSEINDGTIEVKGIAREPGVRTKLAVYSTDERVDPVGACVGLRGQRVKNIVRELNNEKVDIIKWDPEITIYIQNALAPAKLKDYQVDERRRYVKVIVEEDQLSLAIGKRGQNARLTSKLTGWHIDVEASKTKPVTFEDKLQEAVDSVASINGITQDQADALVHAGFSSIETLQQAEISDFSNIPSVAESAQEIFDAVHAEDNQETRPQVVNPLQALLDRADDVPEETNTIENNVEEPTQVVEASEEAPATTESSSEEMTETTETTQN